LSLAARMMLMMIRAYRATLAPMLGGACRYEPSCSQYAMEAIERYGALAGARLALRRVLRCRPFSSFGYDPVPEQLHGKEIAR
jgi:hypothetical protein